MRLGVRPVTGLSKEIQLERDSARRRMNGLLPCQACDWLRRISSPKNKYLRSHVTPTTHQRITVGNQGLIRQGLRFFQKDLHRCLSRIASVAYYAEAHDRLPWYCLKAHRKESAAQSHSHRPFGPCSTHLPIKYSNTLLCTETTKRQKGAASNTTTHQRTRTGRPAVCTQWLVQTKQSIL